jgi:transposase
LFVRIKKTKQYSYLQIVESYREGSRVKQRVLTTLGQMQDLIESGKLDNLTQSLSKFSEKLQVLDAHKRGAIKAHRTLRIGPALVFERLWQQLQIPDVIQSCLGKRRFQFSIERAVFLTVLHRLFDPGSDRAAEHWHNDYLIHGLKELELQHLYRCMGWLGEKLSPGMQDHIQGLPQRCWKDLIEERLFRRNQDLFSSMELVFFDTTSIYFEGQGGCELGQYGHSKDHRSDELQMVVGVIIDGRGRPICTEFWPGNVTDVTTLVPVIERLNRRFGITRVCVVADRGMISKETVKYLQEQGLEYILGARMHRVKEISTDVLLRRGTWEEVYPKKLDAKDPSPLSVSEEWVGTKRYVVCFNPDQAKKDAGDRQAILKSLEQKLKSGDKSLVGNKGYRKYLCGTGPGFSIDEQKVQDEERFDGKWVLETNTTIQAAEVALKYKQLLMVESIFRSMKSVLETRPIYHKRDDTIRGHVFCSFLALLLIKELDERLEKEGAQLEWERMKQDLETLQEVEVEMNGKRFWLRTDLSGTCATILKAVGVAAPPTMRG